MPKLNDIYEADDLFGGGIFATYIKDIKSDNKFLQDEFFCRSKPMGNIDLIDCFIRNGVTNLLFKCIFLSLAIVGKFSDSFKMNPKDYLVNLLVKIIAVFGKDLSIFFLAAGSTWMHKVRVGLQTKVFVPTVIEADLLHLITSISVGENSEGCEINQAETGRFRSLLGGITEWSKVVVFCRSLIQIN